MNQILMVENKKKKKSGSGPADIKNVIIVFLISLIIFGVFYIGQGSYAIYKESKGRNNKNLPVVNIERVNDKAIITVTSSNKIKYLKYSWNNAEETSIPVNANYAEEEIILPIENSVLNVVVEDSLDRAVKFKKQFDLEGVDITEPTIEVTKQNDDGSIKISATDETEMSYITYKINDEEEIKIEKSATENRTINYIIKLPRGENRLVVTACDKSGNMGTYEKKIVVSTASTIDLKVENGKLIVTVKDQDGIKDIEVNLNGVEYAAKDINLKEASFPLVLKEGVNTLSIKVTNVNSLVTSGAREFNYAQ